MKAVFSAFARCIKIWLYSLNASIKLSSSWLVVASTTVSMCGQGKEFFEYALFKYVISIHTLHFPFFLWTTKKLASKSGYCTSLTDPILRSFSTSFLITLLQFGANFCLFCWMGLNFVSTFSWCVITRVSIPFMSSWLYAKQWHFIDMNWTNQDRMAGLSLDLISTFLLVLHGWIGISSIICSISSVGGPRCNY